MLSEEVAFTPHITATFDAGSVQMASQISITVRAQPAAASSAALRGKKRPGSPAVSAAQQNPGSGCSSSGGSGGKKKKQQPTVSPATQTQVKGLIHTPQ